MKINLKNIIKKFKIHKKAAFLCQIDEAYLKVIKCVLNKGLKREFAGFYVEPIAADIDDKNLADKLNQAFSRLGYNNNPVIISLPRNQATSRYLKIPSANPQEIKRIVTLQAPRYLPYPADELISAFEIISTEKDGYSYVNQVIVRKKIVEHYIGLFKDLNRLKLNNIILSSYGIYNLYNHISRQEPVPVMLIDIDSQQIQAIITHNNKLIFSRSFKLLKSQPNWQDVFVNEVKKTQEAYEKETGKDLPAKIIFIGEGKDSGAFMEIIKRQLNLPVEILPYTGRINLSKDLVDRILNSDISFASLIGLGLRDTNESLSLLTENLKKEIKGSVKLRERLRIILFFAAIILMLGLGIMKDLDNRTRYLTRLKTGLDRISKEAKGLEDIDKRFKLLASRMKDKPALFSILYELNQIMPSQVSLSSLNYEENKQVVLRAKAPELNYVFMFVSQLEKSQAFKDFDVKIKYATKRKTQTAEFIDFEIICLKSPPAKRREK